MTQAVPGSRKTLPTKLIEFGIVGLICGTLSCCLWPIVRDQKGPAGDPIPKQPPDEANRYHHPAGFSIVVPPLWDARPSLLAPRSSGRYARRSKALIKFVISRGTEFSGLERLKRTTFLGREAYEGMEVVRAWSFDDGAWSEYTLTFRRGEDWYAIKYGIAEERTSLPEMVRRYINTWRWDEPAPLEPPGAARPLPSP